MTLKIDLTAVKGLQPAELRVMQKLLDVYNRHRSANAIKDSFYEG